MNKMNNVNQNINFPKDNLNLGSRVIYFVCGVFIVMVFCVIATMQSIPAKAQSAPCYSSLNNQYSICYTEYSVPSSSSASASTQTPVQVAQTTLNPNDFIASPPAQSSQSSKPAETPPEPTPTPAPTPTPVEKPKSVPAPTPTPVSPSTSIESSSQPTSSSEPATPLSQSSQPETKSQPPTQSTPEFGLGQAGTVSSISISKSAQAAKDNNNWSTLLLKNWIYILAVIVIILFIILLLTIIRRFQKRPQQTPIPISPTQVTTNYPIPDLNDLTYRLDNMPPEIEVNEMPQFASSFETTTTNIPTFDSDELNFGISVNEPAVSNHPFEPIQVQYEEPPVEDNPPITNAVGGNFSSIIQERLQQPQILDPEKQALNNQLWAEYNHFISGKKSKPFPITNKDRIFFAYCLAYMTAKVYVVDWDLWGE